MDPYAAQATDRVAVSLLPDQAEVRLGERALAVARVLLAIAALFVSYFLPPPPIASFRELFLFFWPFSLRISFRRGCRGWCRLRTSRSSPSWRCFRLAIPSPFSASCCFRCSPPHRAGDFAK